MKRFAPVIAALLAVSTLFAACSGGGGGASGAPAASGTSDAAASNAGAAKSGEAVTITMIESLTSPERTALLRSLADKFQAENPGILVEIVSPPLEGADQKISQMLQAKQKLDVIEVRDHTIKMFVNNGWLAPLNSYIDAWPDKETLTETCKTSMKLMGDQTYLIPSGFYQRSLFYRADWFKEAGLEPPKTWQELYEAGKKLTDPAKNRYGWSFRGGAGGVDYADMLYWAYNGSENLADPFNAYFMKDGTTIYSSPASKEALTFHKKLYDEISPKDAIAWGFSEMVQGFVGGTTAMLIQDPEVIATCQSSMEEGTWAVAPLPVGPSGQSCTSSGYGGWGMTSYSEHPEEAMKFIQFLSSPENNTEFTAKHSLIPIHTTAPDLNPVFKEGPFAVFTEMGSKPDQYKLVLVPQGYSAYAEHRATADEWYQKYLTGAISLEDCIKHFDDYWMAALTDEGKIWEK